MADRERQSVLKLPMNPPLNAPIAKPSVERSESKDLLLFLSSPNQAREVYLKIL